MFISKPVIDKKKRENETDPRNIIWRYEYMILNNLGYPHEVI